MIIFPDPFDAALAILRASTHPELLAMHFGTKTPTELGEDLPGLPWVALSLIGTDVTRMPFWKTPILNVRAWASSDRRTLRALELALAALTAHEDVKPSGGALLTTDPDSGQPLASAAIRLRLRPQEST